MRSLICFFFCVGSTAVATTLEQTLVISKNSAADTLLAGTVNGWSDGNRDPVIGMTPEAAAFLVELEDATVQCDVVGARQDGKWTVFTVKTKTCRNPSN